MTREAAEAALQHAAAHSSGSSPELCSTQHQLAAPNPEADMLSGDVSVTGTAPAAAVAGRVEGAVMALLDAGVPVDQLATVIGEHPSALAADPDAEWNPKVSRAYWAVYQFK
jgi:hypothetical protein